MKETELFDYQQEMKTQIDGAFSTHQSVMVQMPTGTGKTHLLAAVVKSEERRVKNPSVWIVAHRRELVAQIADTLARFDLPILSNAETSLSTDCSSFILVMSIQWLTLHYREMREVPSLIVIDEAHHAVANTYAEVLWAFPKAKKLGLTATPCRLNGKGFTDLFDILLTSWSMKRYIAEGRLSLYDYYSIKPDSEDQLLIDSLKKRGADGDYQLKEMNEVMDVRPSLERLCLTVKRYVPKQKGIVYAFSIEHAEHIAEYYREHDINAVAISSKTPLSDRKSQIALFKKGKIRVLVSVDLFSEGFDCPDVQFIQLARPTLSLSKYLQMVGRGLRVARKKTFCVILDNVGLYRRFGLPSEDRDWQQMFEGRTQLADELQEVYLKINNNSVHWGSLASEDEEMMKILGHDRQKRLLGDSEEDEIVADKKGWIDRRSGIHFDKRPQSVRLLGVDFCTEDGKLFYPRIRSKFIDDKGYINLKSLELQVGRGFNWKRKFIPLDEPDKVYQLQDKLGSVRLYMDEEGNFYAQGNPDLKLTQIYTQDDMNAYCMEYSRKEKAALLHQQKRYKHGDIYPIYERDSLEGDRICKEANEIWHVTKDKYGESYWVDGFTGMKHYCQPIQQQRGFVYLLKERDWYYVRNIPDLADKPLRNWQIVADENLCLYNNEFLFLKQEPRLWFKIMKKTDDLSYLLVKRHYPGNKNNYDNVPDIFITQDKRNGLKMESLGVPYIPYFQTVSRQELKKYNLE